MNDIRDKSGSESAKTHSEKFRAHVARTHRSDMTMFNRTSAFGTLLIAALTFVSAGPAEALDQSAAAKELWQELGVHWSKNDFNHALYIDKNYPAIELFFKGGWKLDYDAPNGGTVFEGLLTNLGHGGRIEGDAKIADLVVKYDVVSDPAKQCPSGEQGMSGFVIYTQYAASNPVAAKVAKAVCNKPAVLAAIDAHLKKLEAMHNRKDYAGWKSARAFLTGTP